MSKEVGAGGRFDFFLDSALVICILEVFSSLHLSTIGRVALQYKYCLSRGPAILQEENVPIAYIFTI